jgi:hypothetical protein
LGKGRWRQLVLVNLPTVPIHILAIYKPHLLLFGDKLFMLWNLVSSYFAWERERMWDVSPKKHILKTTQLFQFTLLHKTWILITFAQQYSQLDHVYAWKFVQFFCVLKNNWGFKNKSWNRCILHSNYLTHVTWFHNFLWFLWSVHSIGQSQYVITSLFSLARSPHAQQMGEGRWGGEKCFKITPIGY